MLAGSSRLANRDRLASSHDDKPADVRMSGRPRPAWSSSTAPPLIRYFLSAGIFAVWVIDHFYEEIYPPDVGSFVYITVDTYTKKQVLPMEHWFSRSWDLVCLSPPPTCLLTSSVSWRSKLFTPLWCRVLVFRVFHRPGHHQGGGR